MQSKVARRLRDDARGPREPARLMWIRPGPRRLRRIDAAFARHVKQPLHTRVVRLEVLIGEGPLGLRYPKDIGVRHEIVLAEAKRDRPAEDRLSAHAVVQSDRRRPPSLVHANRSLPRVEW